MPSARHDDDNDDDMFNGYTEAMIHSLDGNNDFFDIVTAQSCKKIHLHHICLDSTLTTYFART